MHIPSLKKLRIAGLIEGCTLLLLLGVAVPLKHVFGIPQGSAIMGPVHGLAFIAYLILLGEAVSHGGWQRRDIVRTALVSIVPFGTFYNDRFIKWALHLNTQDENV